MTTPDNKNDPAYARGHTLGTRVADNRSKGITKTRFGRCRRGNTNPTTQAYRLGICLRAGMIVVRCDEMRAVLSAGRLMRKRFFIMMMLVSSLVIAGCSSSSDSGSVYTVKRGDTLYRISRTTGTSLKDLARLN